MKVQLRMGEWMITMGIVGLYRVFEYGLRNEIIDQQYRQSISVRPWGLELDIDVLPQLPKAYFLYLIDEYSVAKRDSEKLRLYMKQAEKEGQFQEALKNIKKTVESTTKEALKYLTHEQLENVLETLKRIKKYEDLNDLIACVNTFETIIYDKKINQKLTIENFKDKILKSFFGQVSFLNNSKKDLDDLDDYIEVFQKDYVTPIFYDLQLEQVLVTASSSEEIIRFLDDNKDYGPFKHLKKAWKLKTIEHIRAYVKERVNKCLLLHNYLAFHNFEEMVFYPIGVANNKALNFNWDLENKQPRPISSLAKFILFFIPAGSAIYFKKEGFDEQSEHRMYAGFVQTDTIFSEILQKNNHFKQMKQSKEPFDRIVSKLVQSISTEAKYVTDHLFFIEISSNYKDRKKTYLHYYHLPSYLANYFQSSYAKKLDYIKPYEYREQFVQHVLRGADPVPVIYKYLRYCIENEISQIGLYIAVRERNRILQLKKGVKDMSSTDKRVYAVFRSGQEIRKALEQATASKAAEQYSASSNKKVNAIAYRLLNAAKAGNQKSFMDTLFRLHMSAEKPISPIFLNALHERDLDFATVANAFIAGLLSSGLQEEQEDVVS
ncbi:CRISPR-associated protein Cst1 [Parageobacillus thermoglucosidasius]|uniref:CRISPR-associated protein Cst1 n=1 Tax=Parageobacillus thermoglucosidasius TaxID=1426 RepID=UPI0001D18E4E|nr:CRISPR-associated protein Cst1 [Parageobacillus thermoglucosidasius]AEH47542.1 CRISPR-associated CXXC_CXXC protein Cst1 [Parageobacillus thermoglucosidasius C56-YS93]MBY6268482.1 type I-B CRISPR-associated protein Cas8b1/Cst1 [Parageobacillus thermoglucosidasius]MED4905600.1 type I-B CRISPR-associated protein Cas8b1/Cst1 [Parageobacillus thermoglucosidasius]MED4913986.1 type I-B CRISPR-associated protein Cas8b1/Cst1 [Parageobacillus thermoglucosidasius]MED4945779.1 type I-B CRISPR-associate